MVLRDTYLAILLSVENKSTQSGNKYGPGSGPDHNIPVKIYLSFELCKSKSFLLDNVLYIIYQLFSLIIC